jgi:hypothetical protein
MGDPPPAAVIEAFSGDPGARQRLPGGQGGSWRVGSLVFKRSGPHSDASWLGPLLASLQELIGTCHIPTVCGNEAGPDTALSRVP